MLKNFVPFQSSKFERLLFVVGQPNKSMEHTWCHILPTILPLNKIGIKYSTSS